jgi:hypothetical protein
MTTIFGTRCAAALYDVGFTFDAVVQSLVTQLGLTDQEATSAALDVQAGSPGRRGWVESHAAAPPTADRFA